MSSSDTDRLDTSATAPGAEDAPEDRRRTLLIVGDEVSPMVEEIMGVELAVTTRALPAGDVDRELTTAIKECDHVLVVIDSAPAAAQRAHRVLSVAATVGTPAGALTQQANQAFLERVLRAGASPILEVPPDDQHPTWPAAKEMLERERERLASKPRPLVTDGGRADFAIGSVFTAGADDYEQTRSLSLLSASMQEFLLDLGEAVRDMIARSDVSPGNRGHWTGPIIPPPRWKLTGNPGGWWPAGEDDPKGRNRQPAAEFTIEDLYEWADHPEGRRHLWADDEGRQRAESYTQRFSTVLIRGESGTGKTLVAELIRDILDTAKEPSRTTPTWQMPAVDVNCAGMTVANFDHEMFGSSSKAWSDINTSVGALARAAHGTVFLDEIGDMSWDAQARLLRFLDDGLIRPTFLPPFPSFTRVIAATNRNLEALIRDRRFKHDLLARFTVQVHIPPLRDRSSAERERLMDFVCQNPHYNPMTRGGARSVTHVSAEARKSLITHEFRDGNFRELESAILSGMRNARRRRSQVMEYEDLPDLMGAHPVYLDEEAARMVHAAERISNVGVQIQLASPDDLDRLARQHGVPLFREPGGDTVVVADGVVYRYSPPSRGGHHPTDMSFDDGDLIING